jgi:hypothetical protein
MKYLYPNLKTSGAKNKSFLYESQYKSLKNLARTWQQKKCHAVMLSCSRVVEKPFQ